jgi:two-component system, chemotaxis family, protein-glutamate methylesterase/glutaminase
MNGLEFTYEVMANFPNPILVISASVQEEDTENVFELLDAGAVDIFPKPRAGLATEYESLKQELINKIKVLSGVKVFTQRRKLKTQTSKLDLPEKLPEIVIPKPSNFIPLSTKTRILAIGSSTGGPQALQTLLGQLPTNFPLPIICVQHISEGFLQGLIDWLAISCRLPIRIAQAGEIPHPGVIYFPPEQKHLEINSFGQFKASATPPLAGHRPSITVLFKSLAQFYGKGVIGVLLTGMGRDGADGMLEIKQLGGFTIAQNEASCVVFGMPKEAIALGAAHEVLPIEAIASSLLKRL